jgi:hypothetical protein
MAFQAIFSETIKTNFLALPKNSMASLPGWGRKEKEIEMKW